MSEYWQGIATGVLGYALVNAAAFFLFGLWVARNTRDVKW